MGEKPLKDTEVEVEMKNRKQTEESEGQNARETVKERDVTIEKEVEVNDENVCSKSYDDGVTTLNTKVDINMLEVECPLQGKRPREGRPRDGRLREGILRKKEDRENEDCKIEDCEKKDREIEE